MEDEIFFDEDEGDNEEDSDDLFPLFPEDETEIEIIDD